MSRSFAPRLFEHGAIRAVVDERRLQYGVVERADLLVLRMIQDNLRPDGARRPIYFSRTMGGYPHALGLGDYTLSQGLARKLLPRVVTPGRDTVLVPGDGWLDVARTEALWRDTFAGHEAIARRGEWPDRASVGIAFSYAVTGLTLAEALTAAGRPAAAAPVVDTVERLARATRTTDLLRSAEPPAAASPSDAPRGREVPVGGTDKSRN